MPGQINLPSLVTELAIDMSQFGGQIGEAGRRGSALGEALGRSMQQRLSNAVRNIPDIEIRADSSQADRDVADLRARLDALSNRRIGVDISVEDALRETEELQVNLDRLSRTHPDISVRTDLAGALAGLETLRRSAQQQGAAIGEDMGRQMQQRLSSAARNIPPITIRADSTQADREVADLRATLDHLSSLRLGIDIDAEQALAQTEQLQEQVERLSREHPSLTVRTSLGSALADLEAVRAAAGRVDAEDVEVQVRTDRRSFSESVAGIGSIAAALTRLSAAVPIAATAAAGVGAIAGAAIAAGAVVGAFTAAAKPQLTDVANAADLYTKAQAAQAEGGKKAQAAQKDYNDALKAMPPATRETSRAFVDLKNDFAKWSDSLASSTMPVFTAGIHLLDGALGHLTPLVKTGSGVLRDFIGSLGKGDAGRTFRDLGESIERFGGPTLAGFLASLKNIGVGLAGVLTEFLPFSTKVAGGLEGLTAKFADFGTHIGGSSGFASFMSYVRDNGPKIVATLAELGSAGVHLVTALGPLGGTTLTIATGFAALLNAIPTGVLEAVAAVLPAIVVAVKGWAIAQALLNVAMDANPIGIIVVALAGLAAAVVYLWNKFTTFRVIVAVAFASMSAPILLFAKIALMGLKWVSDAILTFVAADLALGAKAFGWIPGIGPKLKAASKAVSGFKDDTSRFFDGAIKKVDGWSNAILSMPQKIKLEGDISDLEKKIDKAKQQLSDKNLPPGKRAVLTGDIDDWNRKLIAAKTALQKTPAAKVAKLTGDIRDWQAKVKTAETQLKTAKGDKKAQLTANITDWTSKINAAQRQLTSMPAAKRAVLTGNIADWTSKINAAKAQLRNAPSSKRASLTATITDLQKKVAAAKAALASIHNKTVTVTTYKQTLTLPDKSSGAYGKGRYAAGGVVPGYAPRVDSVAALLSPGEGILVPETVRRLGAATVHALNAWGRYGATMPRMPRFADGGIVAPPPAPSSAALLQAYASAAAPPQPIVINMYGAQTSPEQVADALTWRAKVGRR